MIRLLLAAAIVFGCREHRSDAEAAEPLASLARMEVPAPCEGCVLELPAKVAAGDPVPLLVVLHGDSEQASKWFERWRRPALERGYGILALQCPEKLGCPGGSWYRWNGDPRWVTDQVRAVAERVELDRSRTVLVGWSGGATFIGAHAERWDRDFAAIVIHGGGVPPRSGRCAIRALPTYFLVGGRNVFHASARELRDYALRCGSDVEWDLTQGADHPAEDRLLDERRANHILDWLSDHVRPRVAG
ncbi:MAG: alpha/beta fold hydrolase [Deltaproteobacteria bacterium]|nr:alpha/beta fold hydrolase [Deltaproteobacteria bacterium]